MSRREKNGLSARLKFCVPQNLLEECIAERGKDKRLCVNMRLFPLPKQNRILRNHFLKKEFL